MGGWGEGGRREGRKRRRVKIEVKIMEKFSNFPMRKEMQTAREHLKGTLSFSFSFSFLSFLRRGFYLLIDPLGFNQT